MEVLWLIFAVFLFIVCAVLLVVEIFVPSFGILSVLAIAFAIAGGGIFFRYGTVTGWIGVGVAAVLIPIVWIIVYRIFPDTRFGKRVILGDPDRDKGDAIPDTQQLEEMLGKDGVVISPLRPVGMCDFEGKRLECVAESGYIERDKKVRVIHVESTQLTVRLIDET